MTPVTLAAEGLVLDSPTMDDVDAIAEYCRDPLFERFLTTPWPYTRAHAEGFVASIVIPGWVTGRELTWAIREKAAGPLIGMISIRTARFDIGYWMGASHRGRGLTTSAVTAVSEFALTTLPGAKELSWECVEGNTASAATARAAGFAYTVTAPASMQYRDGSHPASWFGTLRAAADAEESRASWNGVLS